MTPWSYSLRDELLEISYNFFGDEVMKVNVDELGLKSIISLQEQANFSVRKLVAVVLPEGKYNFNRFLIVFLDGILIGSGKGGVFISFLQFENCYYEENTLTFLAKRKGIRITAEWLKKAKVGSFFVACQGKVLPWRDTLCKSLTRSGYRRPARLSKQWLWKKNVYLLNKKVSCSKIPVSEEERKNVRYLLAEGEKRGAAQLAKILDMYNEVV